MTLKNIELIASENYASKDVLSLQGSILANKYAEGYPGHRYYGGCQYIDIFENTAIEYLKDDMIPISNIVADREDAKNNSIELAFNTHPNYWRKGYTTEALKEVIKFLFQQKYKNIICGYDEGNIKSKNIGEKLGFLPYETIENSWQKDGIMITTYKTIMNKKGNDNMEKILTFIINNNNEFLMLHGNDTDPQFHESFWYVVTGSAEKEDNDLIDTVKREIYEETNLKTNKIIDLDWVFEYDSLGDYCIEHAFISYVDEGNIILNEENFEYKWCTFDEFINEVKWFYDKKELVEKLNKYMVVK